MTLLGHHLTWLWLAVNALAVFRLTRLVVADCWPLWVPVRERIVRRWPPRCGAWSEIVVCPWCLSPWVAVLVVLLAWLAPAIWTPIAVVLAFSAVAGFLAEHS